MVHRLDYWETIDLCYGLDICAPPPPKKISYVNILTSKIMVLGGGVFGRLLDHDSGSSQNWINTLIKGTPEN